MCFTSFHISAVVFNDMNDTEKNTTKNLDDLFSSGTLQQESPISKTAAEFEDSRNILTSQFIKPKPQTTTESPLKTSILLMNGDTTGACYKLTSFLSFLRLSSRIFFSILFFRSCICIKECSTNN